MENKEIMRFDIETCPECLTEVEWASYSKKQCREKKADNNPDIDWTFKSYQKKAGLYPEFSRIVCISFSCKWTMQTVIEEDERALLQRVKEIFAARWSGKIGGFNIYGFDIPFLRKRMVMRWIIPPTNLCIANIKPREMDNVIVDVFQMRKQTSFSCSLDLLSLSLLGESPKSDWAGDVVASAWNAKNYDWIKNYCEWDVNFTIRCYKAIMNPEATRSGDFFLVSQEVKKRSEPQAEVDDVVADFVAEKTDSAKEIAEAKMAEELPFDNDDLPF